MKKSTKILIASLSPAVGLILILWFIKGMEFIFSLEKGLGLGVQPRSAFGLVGVLTAPLIHGDWEHLLSNTFPLLVLLTSLVYFYYRISKTVFLYIYFLPNIGVWLIGVDDSSHIGASGVVYGLAGFLFFSGLFRNDKQSMAVSLLVALIYGGMIWGVLPLKQGISWESHMMGALVGASLAFVYRNKFPRLEKRYHWQQKGNSNLSYTFDDEGFIPKIVYDYQEKKPKGEKMETKYIYKMKND
ncbi:MAG: rhomboid family intramembrane serine protease [Cytophagales bacterium]|nr:rhomboid family intramembrane serine protease [Cytophagales bacterium]